MDTEKKIGSEITVRISLTFQDAPDVHTLLAMTPVRQRGKLVRLALERYIVETGHSAGNVEAQIEAISGWLRSRNTPLNVPASYPTMSQTTEVGISSAALKDHLTTHITTTAIPLSTPTKPQISEHRTEVAESSMKRWLGS
jgi:hypothetical protein